MDADIKTAMLQVLMYTWNCLEKEVKIIQKYLVARHKQMEVDRIHAFIERKLIGDIFTPRDYIVVMKTYRILSAPYQLIQIQFADFRKLGEKFLSNIRPGK